MKIFIYAAYIGGEYIIYYFTLSHNKWVGLGRDLRNAILVHAGSVGDGGICSWGEIKPVTWDHPVERSGLAGGINAGNADGAAEKAALDGKP